MAKHQLEPENSSQTEEKIKRENNQNWNIWRKIEVPEINPPMFVGEQLGDDPPTQIQHKIQLILPKLTKPLKNHQ